MMNRSKLAILISLALLSAVLISGLSLVLPHLHPMLYILATILLFLLIFLLFDNILWHYLPFNNEPNLHGDWLGRLSTSYTESSHVEAIRVRIVQRWLSTRIDFIGNYSSSSSYASVFFQDTNGQYLLAYIYRSEPYEGQEEKVPAHVGLSVLRLVEAGRLSGYYHHLFMRETGPEFTHGQLVLTRKE